MCRVVSQPTSGLSSKDAIDLVLYLQTIAHVTQATVLLTIHQPPASAYAALDDVLILKQGNLVCVYLREGSRLVPINLTDVLYLLCVCVWLPVCVAVCVFDVRLAGIMARPAVFPRTSGTWDCGWM